MRRQMVTTMYNNHINFARAGSEMSQVLRFLDIAFPLVNTSFCVKKVAHL